MSDSLPEIERRVIRILSEHFKFDHYNIEPGSRLVEDLCVDSIILVEVVMELNEAFDVELPEQGVECWRCVADVCRSVALGIDACFESY